MKKTILKTISLLMIFCMMFSSVAYADDGLNQVPVTEVVFSQSLDMLKGTTEYIGLNNIDANTSLTLTSSNPVVASVSADGAVNAVKCGRAVITVKAVKNGVVYTSCVNVCVEIARNKKTKTYGKKSSTTAVTNALPVVCLPIQLAVKGVSRISVDFAPQGSVIDFASSNADVASVNSNGEIKAIKSGEATITATINTNGNTVKYLTKVYVVKSDRVTKISKKARNKYYSTSAFVGSSIGVGQRMYFNTQGKGYLGNPLMLVRGCYSFMNDKRKVTKYMIQYKGRTMQAKDAIRKSGVDKVFISMGTNDLFKKAEYTYKDYVEYLEGIRKKNPKVVIFIESTTSVHASKQLKNLNSKAVKKLNSMIEKYCKTQKDMYFVDVSSKMNDKNGHLKTEYCSDHYVHLTNKAYALWMSELNTYTDKLMLQEQNATDAVKTAVESKDEVQIQKAKALVSALEKSTVKTELSKKLNSIK